MSLLLVRCTLRGGLGVGLAIGAGIALADALHAAAGAADAAPLLGFEPVRMALGVAGAAVLTALGARTLWSASRVRPGGEADAEVATPRRAFAIAVAGTASNPLTIASWAAIFAAASVAGGRRHRLGRGAPGGGRGDRPPDLGHAPGRRPRGLRRRTRHGATREQ